MPQIVREYDFSPQLARKFELSLPQVMKVANDFLAQQRHRGLSLSVSEEDLAHMRFYGCVRGFWQVGQFRGRHFPWGWLGLGSANDEHAAFLLAWRWSPTGAENRADLRVRLSLYWGPYSVEYALIDPAEAWLHREDFVEELWCNRPRPLCELEDEADQSGLRRWYRSAGDGRWYTTLGRWWVDRLVFQALEPQELECLLALPPRGAFSVCPRYLATPKRRLRYHPPASGLGRKGVIIQDMFADDFWLSFEEAYGQALADALAT